MVRNRSRSLIVTENKELRNRIVSRRAHRRNKFWPSCLFDFILTLTFSRMPNALAERLLDQADRFLKARNFASAAPIVDQALQMEPKNLRALSFGAFLAALNGKKDMALELIGQALKLGPDKRVVNYYAPHVFFNCGQRDRACRLWEQWSKLQPHSVEPLWNLAVHHANEDDAETAEMYLRKVMELAPRHPDLHKSLGHAAKDAGRIQEAIAWYREGARLFPQDIRESSNYLLALHYDPSYGPEQIHAE
jgi:tetratricopeptide (TPR) repeat protein